MMRILAAFAFLAASFTVAMGSTESSCLQFEPAMESIVGKLVRQIHPGPPNYESIKAGDRPESYWFIQLETAVCVAATPGDEINSRDVREVRSIQLVLAHGEYATHKHLLGKCVKAVGTLFASHTGHHHGEVLLTVSALMPVGATASSARSCSSSSSRPSHSVEGPGPGREDVATPTQSLAIAIDLCEELALPNSMARPPGFDFKSHLRQLDERRRAITLTFHTVEGVRFLASRLHSEQDDLAAICILTILAESRLNEARPTLVHYAQHGKPTVREAAARLLSGMTDGASAR